MLSVWRQRQIAGIVVGALITIVVTRLRLFLAADIAGADMALIFYFVAVIVAASIGGATAGITTMAVALIQGIVVIIGARAFWGWPIEWVRVAVFAAESVAISVALGQLQLRTRELKETARDLAEERVLVDRMALEDFMTGLGNRRAFEIELARALSRSKRDGTPLTVAIADVDGLKTTNDVLGHAAGDALLTAVAQTLSASCRASDAAYRIGGDEFALLLPHADRDDYEALYSRFRELVAGLSVRFLGVGVSIGAAHAPEDGSDAIALVCVADERMYAAKTTEGASG